MKTIDCRGLACPQPVIETKKALTGPEAELLVLLDDPASKENVRRFAESQGHRVNVSEAQGVFKVKVEKGNGKERPGVIKPEAAVVPALATDFVVFIDTDYLGRGPEQLGSILMRAFLQTLEQMDTHPKKIILMNSGVKLACEGSQVLEDLQEFAGKGVEILSCGTCLDFFGLKKNLMVGKVSNMYEILKAMTDAGKVIKI